MADFPGKLFGDYLILIISDLKSRWWPNKEQKAINKKKEKQLQISRQFYSNFLKKFDLCFDVGANVGNRVSVFLDIGAKVVAIEPQESCYRFLRYKFGNSLEIVKKGLGEAEGVKDFHVSNASTISSFSKEWITKVKTGRFQGYHWKKVVQVEMTTLDKLIEVYGKPEFIKIDVEGYELEVLKGLTQPVNTISFEYTVPEQTNKVIECMEQIDRIYSDVECNYSIGESMVFALKDWLSVKEMEEHVITKEFVGTGFGDVYVRRKR